jgi:lauroyl/myristoyl acyltransferase
MSVSSACTRLKQELTDLIELVMFPGLAAVLPWRWCFPIFKRLARMRWLYKEPCEAALTHARARAWAGNNEAHWLWVRRLVTLVDHADHYLGRTRSDHWMHKHLGVQGAWPAPDLAAVLMTFHWGAGYWGLRHAAAHGFRPHALVASLDSQAYQHRTILSWYARARNANVAQTLGAPNIDVALHLKQVIRALRDQHTLLGVVDVPSDEAKASMTIELLGMQASVPRGLLRLAVDNAVPVVLYVTGLNTRTGERFLRIKPLGIFPTVEDLAQVAFGELALVIREDPPAWHFWGIADRFFRSGTPQ